MAEVRTGRGGAVLVRGREDRYRADQTSRKGKGKVTEESVSMKPNKEDLAAKENSKRRGRKRRNGSEWRQTWELVAHTPRPFRIPERKRRRKVSNSAKKRR